jgi:hypothetical protein
MREDHDHARGYQRALALQALDEKQLSALRRRDASFAARRGASRDSRFVMLVPEAVTSDNNPCSGEPGVSPGRSRQLLSGESTSRANLLEAVVPGSMRVYVYVQIHHATVAHLAERGLSLRKAERSSRAAEAARCWLSSIPAGSSRPEHTSAPARSLAASLLAVGTSAGAQLARSGSLGMHGQGPAFISKHA